MVVTKSVSNRLFRMVCDEWSIHVFIYDLYIYIYVCV